MTSSLPHMLMAAALIVLVGCTTSPFPITSPPVATPIPPTATPIPPTATSVPLTATPLPPTQTPTHLDGSLSVISPLETTELYGGQALRAAVFLVDHDDQPVEGAKVQMELWSPGGEVFAALSYVDKGQGRYVADPVQLPMRGAGGTWRVVASAAWGAGGQAQAERTFTGIPSPTEMYQSQYGFWIDPPRILNYNLAMHNLHEIGGFHFEDWYYEDGGGYVVLDNYRYNATGVTFAEVDVHWRHGDFPTDEAAAIAHLQSLAGPNHQDHDTPITDLTAEATTFQDRSAWHVTGQWKEAYTAKSASSRSAEWLIFGCPGSDWVWTLVISADNAAHINYLRTIRWTFECPTSK
jgi:hypothetical protein